MTPPRPTRDPVTYIHGDGATIIMPTRVAVFLLEHAALERWRVDNIGINPEVDAVLKACRIAADLQAAAPQVTSLRGSQVAPKAEVGEEWVTTNRAAHLLGITTRGVRNAIAHEKLAAERVDDRWRIRRRDVDRYAQARKVRQEGSR